MADMAVNFAWGSTKPIDLGVLPVIIKRVIRLLSEFCRVGGLEVGEVTGSPTKLSPAL